MFSEICDRIAVAGALDSWPTSWIELDVRGLIDGPGNALNLIEQYVADGIQILSDPSSRLVVVCDYGQSRSNFIAAQIYSQSFSVSLENALEVVRSKHSDSKIKTSLLETEEVVVPSSTITNIAITGAAGFIGSRLSKKLAARGYQCLALGRGKHGNYLESSDDLHKAIDGRCDLLIHLAHSKPFNSDHTSQQALTQLISVVNYCEDHCVRLLYPSGWVVFDGSSEKQVTFSSTCRPHTRYGRLKAASEAIVRLATQVKLDARILRLPALFGEDSMEPRFLRFFVDCVLQDRKIIFHEFENGSARVPLLHVDHCIEAFAEAVASFESIATTTHVGPTNLTPTIQEIAERFASETGQLSIGTPVKRQVFNGHFVPDIQVGSRCPSDEIHNFLLNLSGKTDGRK